MCLHFLSVLRKCCLLSSGLHDFKREIGFHSISFISFLSGYFEDLLVLIFQKFNCDVSWNEFLCVYSICGLLSFLNFYTYVGYCPIGPRDSVYFISNLFPHCSNWVNSIDLSLSSLILFSTILLLSIFSEVFYFFNFTYYIV